MKDEKIEQPDWVNYWNSLAPSLEKHIEKHRIPEAESYIVKSFGFFSYVTEEISTKVTNHKELFAKVYVLIVELQDLLRSTLIAQQQLLLATSALNLRTAFEISCNLEFIYQHDNPEVMMQRMEDFFRYEKIVGSRLSRFMDSVPEDEEKAFADKHPFWKNNRTGLLKDTATWNGEGLGFKQVAEKIGKEKEYVEIYKISSKFVHGSPVVINMYRSRWGTNCLTTPDRMTNMNMMCCHTIMEALMSFCNFFGVPFSEVDYRMIQVDMLKVEPILKNMEAGGR
jgi:hypothetical protein